MQRFFVLLFAVTAARGALATDRLIPVMTGTIGDRTYRTTVDLRSPTTEECRFEFRAPDGATLHSVEQVEAGQPKLLDEFASELPASATTIRASCTGTVEVHSRIHESADGGVTFDEGHLFEAVTPQPLAAGQNQAMPVTGDFILAEVHGAPARVVATLTATSSHRIAEKQYHLTPFGERSIGMAEVLRALGAIDATFEIEGEGRVIVIPEVIDPAFANHARPRLHAQTAAPPRPITALLSSTFQAAPFTDPATGLVFLRNRWYDPETGTFLSPDPIGYADSSNLYAFCGGDPVNCSDPTGTIGLKAALTDGIINEYEMSTLELTGDEIQTIIGSQGALKLVGADTPTAAQHNLTRAKFILQARNPAFKAYAGELYQLRRGLNPVHFAAEMGWAIASGEEPTMGNKINRRDKVLELATYLAFMKGTELVLGHLRAGALPPRVAPAQKPPLVIGEGMKSRVVPYAKAIGADYYVGAGPSVPETAYLEHNRQMIRAAMEEGRQIIDIGPNPARANYPNPTSPNYAMELQEIARARYKNYVRRPHEPERLVISNAH